jgi:hypothetical protein
MNWFWSKKNSELDRAVSEIRGEELDAKTLSSSADRVWQRLQSGEEEALAGVALQPIRGCADIRAQLPAFHKHELAPARALIVEDHLRECVSCRSYAHGRAVDGGIVEKWQMAPASRGFQWSFARMSLAAAALILVAAVSWTGYTWYFAPLPGSRARIDSIEGQAYGVGWNGGRALKSGDEIGEGEFIRTAANSHARVVLFDGSKVEMNQRAEFAVSANRRNTTIHLDQGIIIVQAAKRRTGHLYVSAPDCNVAVTGTVFSVNAGTKGSRVGVIEGEVHVKHEGAESILHSGEVLATTQSIGVVPVQDEIAWSDDRDHELALLREFSTLHKKFSEIQLPGPRYQSNILPLLPSDTVLYVGVPNLGDALQQANQIFQQQLGQSEVLRQWWNKSNKANQHPTPDELIQKIRTLSQYLGDEVVITMSAHPGVDEGGPVLLAEVRQSGLKDFLQNHIADAAINPQGTSDVRVLTPESLSSLAGDTHGMIMLVRTNMLVIGGDAASILRMNAQLNAGTSLFASTDFGKKIGNVYGRGTEIVVAANLGQMIGAAHSKNGLAASQAESKSFQSSGFDNIQYLIATRGEAPGNGDNRITLEFNGERHGIASWLAAPNPVGSLDYVSANAGAAFSFVGKQPALMVDDFLSTVGNDPDVNKGLAEANAELGFDIRNDLATALGGEMTVALDGPVLPTPSWKVIIEVNNSGAIQLAIEKLIQRGNLEEAKAGRPGVTIDQELVGGRSFYAIHVPGPGITSEYDYTFADGYMLLAPSRAMLLNALQTHANGTSLARSASFRTLLPSDNQANFSAMFYQNLGPILKPLASQLSSQQLALLQQLAADSKPSVICAYGESDRIEIASSGKLFDLNPSILGLSHLLEQADHGTSRKSNPY